MRRGDFFRIFNFDREVCEKLIQKVSILFLAVPVLFLAVPVLFLVVPVLFLAVHLSFLSGARLFLAVPVLFLVVGAWVGVHQGWKSQGAQSLGVRFLCT